jgi:pimeloyl-ACP methyl ester carboxylesterase
MQELLFTRSNSQVVAYFDYGQSENVLFFHHGMPTAGPLSPDIRRNADANNFRIIGIVRPGYGNSTAIPGRTIDTIAEINLEVANAFGVERFAVVGGSAGGPHALASAHLAGSRCIAQLIIAGAAPYDVSNFDFVAGMTEEGRDYWLLPLTSLDKFEASIEEEATAMSSYSDEQIREMFNVDAQDPSADEVISTLQAKMKYSFLHGTQGWKDDHLAFLKPWGFSLGETSMPVQLWTGTEDVNVPQSHSHYLYGVIPNSELRVVDGKNHGTIIEPAVKDGFRWLREIFDSNSPILRPPSTGHR